MGVWENFVPSAGQFFGGWFPPVLVFVVGQFDGGGGLEQMQRKRQCPRLGRLEREELSIGDVILVPCINSNIFYK